MNMHSLVNPSGGENSSWKPRSEAHSEERPRQRPKTSHNPGTPSFGVPLKDSLRNWLTEARQALQQDGYSDGNIEIELRFGLLVSQEYMRTYPATPGSQSHVVSQDERREKQVKFVSGVDGQDFRKFSQCAENHFKSAGTPEVSDSYNFNDKRIKVGSDGITMEKKRKIQVRGSEHTIDVALPACPYDVRMGVTVEAPMPSPYQSKVQLEQDNWESKRQKDRTTFEKADCEWQLDMTAVRSSSKHDQRQEETYELEFELKAGDVSRWMDEGFPIEDALVELIEKLMPRDIQALDLEKVTDRSVISAALDVMRSVCPDMLLGDPKEPVKGRSDGRSSYPGAQPVGMRRHHVKKVLDGDPADYWVAEKTDGVRYLMVIAGVDGRGQQAVLVDRKMECYLLPGMDFYSRSFERNTILDGELVQNRTWKRLIFMVFDIILFSGQRLYEKPFSERCAFIEREVIPRYSKVVEEKGSLMPPTPLVRKKWYPRKHVHQVINKMGIEADGSVCYKDPSSNSRHHKSDGLILVPNRFYARGTDFQLLKYKEGCTMTLDFKVMKVHQEPYVKVWFDGENHQQIDFTGQVHMPYHDLRRLYGDMASITEAVCEFAFNPDVGKWQYKLIRHDKDRSNFHKTILDTIAALAENLSQDELEFKMLSDTWREAEDEWARCMKQATRQVLESKKQSSRPSQ